MCVLGVFANFYRYCFVVLMFSMGSDFGEGEELLSDLNLHEDVI